MGTPEIQAIRHHTSHANFSMVMADLADFPVRVIDFHPGRSLMDQLRVDRAGRVRGIVLGSGGGGEGLEVNDLHDGEPVYAEEMRMAVDPDISYFGVCLGKQIGVAGFARFVDRRAGPYVQPLAVPYEGPKVINLAEPDLPAEVTQVGSHDFCVPVGWVPPSLEVLGTSAEGTISEVVCSRERNFYGQQFHSERRPGSHNLAEYVSRFAAMSEMARAA